ncbi:MAG: glycosyltransferase family 4 protein [Candidatus Helarchaeota archaeon]
MNLVLFIRGLFPERIGGQEIYGFLLTKRLIELKQNVTVIMPGSLKINKRGLRIISFARLNIPIIKFFLKLFFYIFIFFRFYKKLKFQLIHANGAIAEGLAAILVKKILDIPVIITLHGGGIYSFAKKFPFIVRFILDKADRIIAINKYLKYMAKQYVLKNIDVLPNFVDTKTFRRKNKNFIIEFKRKFGITDEIIMLMVSRLVSTKGIDVVIRLFSQINREFPFTRLMIIGEGPEKKNLIKLTKNLKLKDKILFLGKISNENLPIYYSACDLFILPSSYEGQPTVILEAMACESPIISYSVGGIPELIKSGVNGFLAPKNDVATLKSKIIELISNPRLRAEMGKNGRNIIEHKFDSTINSKKILTIYLSILKEYYDKR